MIYTYDGKIRFSEVGVTGELTVPGVVNYFQDGSIYHSESIDIDVENRIERSQVWILLSWQIEFVRFPKLSEKIKTSTWATNFDRFYGYRNFRMKSEDGEMLAYANTVWVYMDTNRGRPVKITEELVSAYLAEEGLDMGPADRKIKLSKEMRLMTEVPEILVKRSQLDTNYHMNNGQYIQVAMDLLYGLWKDKNYDEPKINKLRVEYKKSALLGEVIVPYVHMEEDKATFDLRNVNGESYAVVKFGYGV
jgi:acyl-ACP thioesterase